MPQSLEVRFALSALPPHLRDGATAYVLDPAAGRGESERDERLQLHRHAHGMGLAAAGFPG